MIRHMVMMWLLFASTASAWAAVADWSEEMKGRPSADRWTYAGIDFSSEPELWVFRPSAYLSSEGIFQPLLDQPKHTLDVCFRFPGKAPTPEDSPGFNHPLLFEQESNRCSETAPPSPIKLHRFANGCGLPSSESARSPTPTDFPFLD